MAVPSSHFQLHLCEVVSLHLGILALREQQLGQGLLVLLEFLVLECRELRECLGLQVRLVLLGLVRKLRELGHLGLEGQDLGFRMLRVHQVLREREVLHLESEGHRQVLGAHCQESEGHRQVRKFLVQVG